MTSGTEGGEEENDMMDEDVLILQVQYHQLNQ